MARHQQLANPETSSHRVELPKKASGAAYRSFDRASALIQSVWRAVCHPRYSKFCVLRASCRDRV